jgi:predicted dehydrogenase
MKLRVGLVGLGECWESRYRPALRALADRFEVRAVCEQVSHRAEVTAAEFSAVAVDGFRVLTSREDIDAILLLSTPWYGHLPIMAACAAGKAVYLGTGLDLTAEEVRQLQGHVEEAGIAFMAEFARRHSPATLRLKELIATRLGPPELLFCHQRLPADDRSGSCPRSGCHRSTKQELMELVDWCRYVVGNPPGWVTGMFHRSDNGAVEENYQMMSLGFPDPERSGCDAVAQISCGRYIPGRWHEAIAYRPLASMQVSCRHGIAFIDLPSTLVWFDEAGRHQESLESERPVGERLLTQFLRSVTSLVRKTNDLDDTCSAISIVEQARRSHEEGRRIELG